MTIEKSVNILWWTTRNRPGIADQLLEEDGYHVECAESGKKALERLPDRNWT